MRNPSHNTLIFSGLRQRSYLIGLGFLLVLFSGVSANSFAQEPLNEQPKTRLPYYIRGQAGFHNYSWQVGGQFAFAKKTNRYRIYDLEWAKIKHPKEVRVQNTQFANARSFIYGKQNVFGTLRAGMGRRAVLGEKLGLRGVEVSLAGSGGISLGVLKPVYLDVAGAAGTSDENSLRSERFDVERHLNADIFGTSDFSQGLDELSFRPGIYGKFGVLFEFADYETDIKGLEVGFVFDAYPGGPIPILALAENYAFWPTFYVSAVLGKRWQ